MEADQSLAKVVKVTSINPIKGADLIELATVLGWQVVVKKNEFNVGDLAIYFSIGSILSKDDPRTSFLEGKPIKTKKIRGVISQGLLAPLSWCNNEVTEGDDLTNYFDVKKWVPAEEADIYKDDNRTKSSFPLIARKTQEERVQNCPKQLRELKDKQVVITQKYDGTSTTFIWYNDKFMVCNRNNHLKEDDGSVYFQMANKYRLSEAQLGRNLAIQGETIGPKINANRHKVNEVDFYVFNIFDIDLQSYLSWDEVLKFSDILGLKTVKVIYRGLMKPEWLELKNLLILASEQKYDTGVMAEGIVCKSDGPYPRTSFKVISNTYLLKYNL